MNIDDSYSDTDVSVHGTKAADMITAGTGNASLYGFDGDDTLVGNAGAAKLGHMTDLYGGAGNDTYFVKTTADRVHEDNNQGIDTVVSWISYTLTDNVENLTLHAGSGDIDGTGNQLDNILTGNEGNNSLYGGDGKDTLYGGKGNDYLDGGTGADKMYGGTGNDYYIVDVAGDVVDETDGHGKDMGGHDTVDTSLNSYQLGAFIEDLRLDGAGNSTGWGNKLDNEIWAADSGIVNPISSTLYGGDGNDRLHDGKFDRATLYGGAGNDTYYVNDAMDQVIEKTSKGKDTGGTDTVISSVTWTLGDFVENLKLDHSGFSINGTGNGLDNHLTGNDSTNTLSGMNGNDWLDGVENEVVSSAQDVDTLKGGAGDDTFVVHGVYILTNNGAMMVYDVVVENTKDGNDTVRTDADGYALADNVENLVLTGTEDISGKGNAGDNTITGNSGGNALEGMGGKDTIFGGEGADTIGGGTGSDTLYGDAGNDKLYGGDDGDTLYGGTGNDELHGDGGANTLYGGAGNDKLYGDGGGASDIETLYGGKGNDTYVVTSGNDKVDETDGKGKDAGGNDTVEASISWKLGNFLENLTLTGTDNINGTGNKLDNHIFGNAGNNTLSGGAGDDWLGGGYGNDTLTGGAGKDVFIFGAVLDGTNNVDHITDFSVGEDAIAIDHSHFELSEIGSLTVSGGFVSNETGVATSANDRFIYNSKTGDLYFDDDGNGVDAAVLFAHLDNKAHLTAADFYIF